MVRKRGNIISAMYFVVQIVVSIKYRRKYKATTTMIGVTRYQLESAKVGRQLSSCYLQLATETVNLNASKSTAHFFFHFGPWVGWISTLQAGMLIVNWRGQYESTIMFMILAEVLTGRC